MTNRKKHLKRRKTAEDKTVPKVRVSPPPSNVNPGWRFHSQSRSEFQFTDECKATVFNKLSDFDSMTVGELEHSGDKLKRYDLESCIDHLHKDVQKALRERYKDFDELYRFRIGGTERIYALHQGDGIFNLIWWDPDHEIYPSQKKHT